MKDKFIHIPFTINNLDIFWTRNSILKRLEESIPEFGGNFLDVGCGKMPYKDLILKNGKIKNYIGLDIETAREYDTHTKPDVFWTSDGKIPLEKDTIQSAMATEVLEHCPDPQAIMNEVCRVLEENGYFFFTVPFLWNLHEVPYDEHRYTPFALERIMKNAGFRVVKIYAHGGWNSSLAQMIALWCRRYWKNQLLKFAFSVVLYPIVWLLYKTDKASYPFKEGDMSTGFYGICKK
jgi:SAM-dependent methyltransferase